ncbi:cytochrome P450 [Phenylobacterium sp.]|uniref:cytochrome P450 n=1 Tax=Phenylobacterium sp. TaxID=1871053 RepID=UPI002ED8343C
MPAVFQGDLYARAALRDPYPLYERLRAMAPAVWMPKRRMWAIARYDDVRAALRAADVLVSGRGVAANDTVNRLSSPVTLTSDGEAHDRRRLTLIQPLTPAPLKDLRPRLEAEAANLVDGLADGRTFEAMSTFAAHLPVTIVAELVGLDAWARARMLKWAAAAFNSLGVMNLRGLAAVPVMQGLGRYVRNLDRQGVTPGGWADRLFDAADRGDISRTEARAMIIDYVAPALDTTILATGQMLWRLATTPGAYDAVRADPSLIPGVVNEAVRMGSPIRGFTRYAAKPFELDGAAIPAGDRALILFASANRDPDKYRDPDRFDVARNPRDHVGWGHGTHTCVGMHLARLEMEILLATLVQRVERIETDRPTPAWNNVLQGFARLPARLVPAAA